MALQDLVSVSLRYGEHGVFACDVDASRVALYRPGPRACDVVQTTRGVLTSPLDFPPLEQAVVEGDSVVLALDRNTPGAAEIVSEIWSVLARQQIDPARVTVLQPASLTAPRDPDPRRLLPADVRDKVQWKIHSPADEGSTAFVTTASTGEEIALARELVDAGLVIPIGVTCFDPILGYRGTASVLYPGLSTVDAIKKTIGLGHQELAPRNPRPLRQLVDEIAWLMGVQFVIQVIPADGGGASTVIAGGAESVFARSRKELDHNWLISLPDRVQTVVVSIPHDAGGHGWWQFGSAMSVARQVVECGGRIIVLTDLAEAPGEGVSMLRGVEFPREQVRAIRKAAPLDLIPATQVASACGWGRVYLKSRLDAALVEDLLMYPIDSDREIQRLLADTESVAFIGSAQHAYGLVD